MFDPVQFQARLNPERPGLAAFESSARDLSYGDIARQVDAAAGALMDVGVGRGQRIGVHCRDGLLQIVIVLALSRLAEVTLVFARDGVFTPGAIDVLVTDEAAPGKAVRTVRIDAAALAASTVAQRSPIAHARSGSSKLVFANRDPISEQSLCARIVQRLRAKGTGNTSRWLCAADIHSELGLSAVLESLWAGGLAVLSRGTFEHDVESIALYDVDRLFIDATLAPDYLRVFDTTNRISARLRTAVVAGVECGEQTLPRVKKHVCPNTIACLDLPETGAVAAGSLWRIGKALHYWPLPGVELRILGSGGDPVESGICGQVAIRSGDGWFGSSLSGFLTPESALVLSEKAS